MTTTNDVCKVASCGAPIKTKTTRGARGYCSRHYHSYRVHGDAEFVDNLKASKPVVCIFSDCERKPYGHGYCNTHWKQIYDGRPLSAIKSPRVRYGEYNLTECSYDSCDRRPSRNRLCAVHASHLEKYGEIFEVGKVPMSLKGYSGRYLDKFGYVVVWAPTHPNKKSDGYILEHRLIMSEHLGRPLLPHENVHHKNGVRDDNRIENLELWSTSQPSGQRVEDKLKWAREFISLYEEGNHQ